MVGVLSWEPVDVTGNDKECRMFQGLVLFFFLYYIYCLGCPSSLVHFVLYMHAYMGVCVYKTCLCMFLYVHRCTCVKTRG